MEIERGTIKDIPFESRELGETLNLWVYLPARFSPLYQYDVCICQDGKDFFQLGRIARAADELLAKGEIEDLIIVGIPYADIPDRRRKYHPDGEQHAAYIRFLAHELAPFLDREFPTAQMASGRALAGDSLAATVSLMAAFKYPHTFGKAALMSPLVNEKVMEAAKQCTDPKLMDIYHIAGKEETEVKTTDGKIQNFITPNRTLHQILEEKGVPGFYDEFDGVHSWKYWQKDLPRALRYLFKKD
ncbi:alpha/beta hydrolase [Heyndrickxia coagulans]|uniref:Alpha/beta hydrolase-fold protein n=1 Tax=Heyndrickxia coagulans TaxID=1398 RepID=A0AAW7CH92_HEYCO|nr:alpha/beta hydrolase-fold protein [Heyndrickxia coagulans]MDL5040253.1 alpha/beta hydrolase-fold protein [Heyndrickxia coagulans]